MNVLAAVAGALTLVAVGIHAFVGGRKFGLIRPENPEKPLEVWLQALCGWHWVSVDLLLASATLLTIGLTDLIPAERVVLSVIGAYFGLCGIVWFVTVVISGRDVDRSLLKMAQWIFCFLISALAFWSR